MQFLEPLDSILGQRSKVRILRFLFDQPLELTGREISRKVGLSHLKTHQVLRELSQHGLTISKTIGKAILYRLNEDNMLGRDILKTLFRAEKELVLKLTGILTNRLRVFVESIVLYGDILQNGNGSNSDIELLLIVRDDMNFRAVEQGLEYTQEEVKRTFGNSISAKIWSVSELRGKYAQEDEFALAVLNSSRLIYGKELIDVIRSGHWSV
ncbi:MAG: winged helix-turn-helix domain-containing protein [Nitrospirota bacterium]